MSDQPKLPLSPFRVMLSDAWETFIHNKNAFITISIIISCLSVPFNYTKTIEVAGNSDTQVGQSASYPAIIDATPIRQILSNYNHTAAVRQQDVIDALPWLSGIAFGVFFLLIILSVVSLASMYVVAGKAQTVKQSLAMGFRNFLGYWWAGFLYTLLVLGGLLLFVVPGIIWAVRYGNFGWVYVVEGKKGMQSLRQSHAYVQGYWWKVLFRSILGGLVIAILTGLVTSIVGALIQIPLAVSDSSSLVIPIGVATVFLTGIVSNGGQLIEAAFGYHLYNNLKQLKS